MSIPRPLRRLGLSLSLTLVVFVAVACGGDGTNDKATIPEANLRAVVGAAAAPAIQQGYSERAVANPAAGCSPADRCVPLAPRFLTAYSDAKGDVLSVQ